jgi:hypothetical protein
MTILIYLANPFSQKGRIMDISNGHSVSHQYQCSSYEIPSGVIMNDFSELRARLDELEKEIALAFSAIWIRTTVLLA